MTRCALLLLALPVIVAGCRLDPEGRCDTRADCPAGLDCLNHVCASCRSDLDCWSHTACSPEGLCELRPGRCWSDPDCPSWDSCDATRTCVLRADHCPNVSCTALQECDPEHHCSLQPGRCLANADCPAWMASCDTAGNRCLFAATAGDDVLTLGTLVEGSCDLGAVARARSAATYSAVQLGLDCGSASDGRAFVDPVSGMPVYRHEEPAGGPTLRRLRADPITGGAGAWRFPADPVADDDIAIVPAQCPIAWDGWIMQGSTGALMYACAAGGEPPQRNYFDDAGLQRLTAVRDALAWNADGYLLVLSGAGLVQVVDPGGTATSVLSLPAGAHLAHRSLPTGFRVALHDDASGLDELWEIDELTAGATKVGDYAGVPSGYAGDAWQVLDDAGALYGGAYLGTREVLMKRPLQPGTTSTIYSEPTGATDFTTSTFRPILRLERVFLFTRP